MASAFLGKMPLTAGAEDGARPEQKVTGIQLVAQMYWQVYEVVHAMRSAGASSGRVQG
jgi:hypothetical protein